MSLPHGEVPWSTYYMENDNTFMARKGQHGTLPTGSQAPVQGAPEPEQEAAQAARIAGLSDASSFPSWHRSLFGKSWREALSGGMYELA